MPKMQKKIETLLLLEKKIRSKKGLSGIESRQLSIRFLVCTLIIWRESHRVA